MLSSNGGGGPSANAGFPMERKHGLLGRMGGGVLMPIGMITARYFRQLDPCWFYTHMAIQVSGFAIGIAGVVLGFRLNEDGLKNVDVHKALGPGGAIEAFVEARKAGKVRFLGFSAHSVEAALVAMDQFDFDTVLFPINFVMYSQANFGPQVVQRAREKQMGMMAIKAMAKTVWPASIEKHHPYSKCWYKPTTLPKQAALALRWTLSQPDAAAVPPGEIEYFRLAMDVAERFTPVNEDETKTLMAQAKGLEPLFHLGSA